MRYNMGVCNKISEEGLDDMEAVRKILDSTSLEPIIPLPKSFRNKKVEVVVFLHEENHNKTKKRHSAFGSLNGYTKPDLNVTEEGAMAKAMVSKHADC